MKVTAAAAMRRRRRKRAKRFAEDFGCMSGARCGRDCGADQAWHANGGGDRQRPGRSDVRKQRRAQRNAPGSALRRRGCRRDDRGRKVGADARRAGRRQQRIDHSQLAEQRGTAGAAFDVRGNGAGAARWERAFEVGVEQGLTRGATHAIPLSAERARELRRLTVRVRECFWSMRSSRGE